ncbi:HEAT repeat-containing protein 6 [Culicoides brevitarsis]|uniref:HEAT repeat-containing protein 6 n=1 Tax=Culicoides brevitarsis TaxID=469753 RepID=UPI00307C9CD6
MDPFYCLKETLKNFNPQQKQQLHVLLNEVNSSDSCRYMPLIEITAIIRLLTQLQDLDEALYCKSFLLINKLVSQSKPSLTGTVAIDCQNWIFDALVKENGIKFECFKSLTIVLKHSDVVSPKIQTEICEKGSVVLGFLQKCCGNKNLETDSEAQDTLIAVVRTVEIICYKSPELSEAGIDGIEKISSQLMFLLLAVTPSNFGSKYFAFAGSCLNVFNHLLLLRASWIEDSDHLQFILGCFKAFASLDEGVNKPSKVTASTMMMPDDDEPSLLYDATTPAANKKKKRPRVMNKTAKKQQNEAPNTRLTVPTFSMKQSSDSEQSDTESPHIHTRHRLKSNAMNLLLTTCQVTERRKLFGNWYIFFDEAPATSLLSIMKTDPSAKCRSMALQTASVIIFKVRQYLQHAELCDNSPYSFTPYTVSLGISMKYIYSTITEMLETESHITVTTQILKCLCTLIGATTFNSVLLPIIEKFLHSTKELLLHKDLTIKVACLTVVESFLGINGISEASILSVLGIDKARLEHQQENWILETIFSNLIPDQNMPNLTIAASLRIQSLQVLQVAAPFIHFYIPYLPKIAQCILHSLQDPSPDVKLHSARALYGITQHINTHLSSSNDVSDLSENYYAFWNEILSFAVAELQNTDNSSSIRCHICDSFAFLECIYDRLSREKQLFFISFITGTSYDDDYLVKAASIRCLAIMAHFPILNEDVCFIDNTLELTKKMFLESNVQGKIKSSWCLAHISDVLIEATEMEMSPQAIMSLLELCSRNPKENEKVRVNLIRCIGNILRLVTASHVVNSEENTKIIKNCVSMIEVNILSNESMKLKWNSCYAAQNLIKNSEVFNSTNLVNWQEKIFGALFKTILESKNFKVKINAITALRRVEERKSYGLFFLKIWNSLIQVLVETSNLINYSEYKYKDSLEDQVCLSICHLILMLEKEDLVNAALVLHPVSDAIKTIWQNIITKISPEESLDIHSVETHLNSLKNNNLSAEQKLAFNAFEFCFTG